MPTPSLPAIPWVRVPKITQRLLHLFPKPPRRYLSTCLTIASVGLLLESTIAIAAKTPSDRQKKTEGPASQSDVRIVERGPHHTSVEYANPTLDPSGSLVIQTNSYVEIANGLNYLNEKGEWLSSEESFEVVPGAALAWKGQQRVSFASNLNQEGSVQVRLPDQRLLVSHIYGLAYYDMTSGKSVLIASVKDCQGVITADNVITYPDAFHGISADVRYTWSKSGYEQDVILREAPAPATQWGLSGDRIRLEVWTEFVAPPQPKKRRGKRTPDDSLTPDDLAGDDALDFGSMQIGSSRIFRVGHESESLALVLKHWIKNDDSRSFLVETVDLSQLAEGLEPLPAVKGEANNRPLPVPRLEAMRALPKRSSKPDQAIIRRLDPENSLSDRRLIAALGRPGLVLDYLTISANSANVTFRSDTTYNIVGPVVLSGSTVIEGGTVIKFDPISTAKLEVQGSLALDTSAYRPATFTSKDDNTVGQTIVGSSGNPSANYYGNPSLCLNNGSPSSLRYLRFGHARKAVAFLSGSTHELRHVQLARCLEAIQPVNTLNLRNVLISNADKVFSGTAGVINGQHLTVNGANYLNFNNAASLSLGNSLIVGVANPGAYSLIPGSVIATTGGFQTAVGGYHYLPIGSPHRNAGTTVNLDPTLLSELKGMTTEAPLLLGGPMTLDTILSPRALRDLDTPDLGAHYSPLDYVLSNLVVTASLTLTNGVVVGTMGSYGADLQGGAKLISVGRPTAMNRFVRCQSVQEQSVTITAGPILQVSGASLPSSISLRFTEIAAPANTGNSLFSLGNSSIIQGLSMEHSQVYSQTMNVFPTGNSGQIIPINLRNNYIDRSSLSILRNSAYNPNVPIQVGLFNNLLRNSSISLSFETGTLNPVWSIKDNLFDGTAQSLNGNAGAYIASGNNGFTSGTSQSIWGANDRTNLNADYQIGALGRRYYPASGTIPSLGGLINLGSRTREAAGLYPFTVKAINSSYEGQDAPSTVDIGFHYIGVNLAGQPLDMDGDGEPDHLEDLNGDGSTVGDTTPFNAYTSPNQVSAGGLILYTPTK